MSLANLNASPPTTASSASAAGKSYRLGRIFTGDGRTVILPVDHGTMLGRVMGLEDPAALIKRFLPLPCDGFLLGPGVAARTGPLFAARSAPSRLPTIDTYWRGDAGRHVLTASVERAGALGVDAVKVLMPWHVPPEERAAHSKLIGQVIGEAEPFGLPVMVEPICLSSPRRPDAPPRRNSPTRSVFRCRRTGGWRANMDNPASDTSPESNRTVARPRRVRGPRADRDAATWPAPGPRVARPPSRCRPGARAR
jgi:DeoC/LacD family aldolase